MYTEVRAARNKGGKSRVGATIAREELKKKLERGDRFFLLETLPEKYYRRAHLPGAMNLPPDRVSEVAPELVSDKSAEVVVYCGSFR
jgi:rhodanese-related sulfurtransferase